MKKSRFTEEQIIAVLKAAEAGKHPTEVCRENGISLHTFYGVSWHPEMVARILERGFEG